MHNLIANVRKGGEFLKYYWAKWTRKQVAFFHVWTVKVAKSNRSSLANCVRERERDRVIFQESDKSKAFTCKLRDHRTQSKGWLHDPVWPGLSGWLALPQMWLLSRYYMSWASPEPQFSERDWKQCACFSLDSFARLPGKRDHLEISSWDPGITILGSQLTRLARLSCNRKVDFCCLQLK